MSNDDTPPYEPATPYYTMPGPNTGPARTPRRGPLSARLAARTRGQGDDTDALAAPDVEAGSTESDAALVEDDSAPDYAPGGRSSNGPAPSWQAFTSLLHTPGGAAQTLRDLPNFGATWASRADMLEACLDEYFQLTARYNDARALLDETQAGLPPLRQQQAAAQRATRDLEQHIELHSRAELREAYLGLAEAETRVFRAEQDCYLLASRIETLENFMGLLSRVIATVRTIPASALEQSASEAAPGGEDEFEEVTLDAATAAELVARGEGEVLGEVDDHASADGPTSGQAPTQLSAPTNNAAHSDVPVQ